MTDQPPSDQPPPDQPSPWSAPAGQPPGGQPPAAPPPFGQPPYGQQPYGQPPYGQYAQPASTGTNGFAIASLVCSFFCTPLGLIFGFVGLSQINSRGQQGRGLAIAGIVISIVSLVIAIAVISSNG
jgi:peptidyl-prolyl cis-trans isomerase B (cyclophilin B)